MKNKVRPRREVWVEISSFPAWLLILSSCQLCRKIPVWISAFQQCSPTAFEHTKDPLSFRNRCLMSYLWSSSPLNQVYLNSKAQVTIAFVNRGDTQFSPSVDSLPYKLSEWTGNSENGFHLCVFRWTSLFSDTHQHSDSDRIV